MASKQIEDDIRRLRLELIEVNTRLQCMGTLSKGYAELEKKRDIISNQIQYLESQLVSAPGPVKVKKQKSRGAEVYEAIEKLRKTKAGKKARTNDELFELLADQLGESDEVAIRKAYYDEQKRRTKVKSDQRGQGEKKSPN